MNKRPTDEQLDVLKDSLFKVINETDRTVTLERVQNAVDAIEGLQEASNIACDEVLIAVLMTVFSVRHPIIEVDPRASALLAQSAYYLGYMAGAKGEWTQ